MSRGKEILLVEDSPDDAELTQLALEDGGLLNHVIWVKDGVEALEHLLGVDETGALRPLPQLVLLDLNMPRMTGLEVLRRMRSEERTRLLPVVILTTSREDADVIAGYRLGANSYVRKPVDFEQFTEAVRQLRLYWLVLNEGPHPSSG
jgi:two-component system response regulator